MIGLMSTCELQVLSHHLSPQLTAMYNKAQQGYKCRVTVLGFQGDAQKEFRSLVRSSAQAYLQE